MDKKRGCVSHSQGDISPKLADAMLRAKSQTNLKNAREYFEEHLCVGDYYSAGQTVRGEWFGHGADKLGLKGVVTEEAFLRLCAGRNPKTDLRLTQRLNSMRRDDGKETPNRRIFYDFTFSPPKSVSVVALYQDARIVELHDRAVRSAMAELEKFAETRVRKAGQFGERPTGEVVAACFQHDTSRELDPHLHTHGVVFNATFDPVEQRWKALDTHGMYRAQKFVENLYFHELCKGLRFLGYEIENNARNFEIRGMPAAVIARFSKRHQQIEEEARKQIARDGYCGNIAELREHVAHDKRRRKMRDSTAGRLRAFWAEQLPAGEKAALSALRPGRPGRPDSADVPGIVAWADEHLFERKAIVHDHELWSAALARGRGTDLDLPAIVAEIERRGYVGEKDTRRLTSLQVLRCELAVVLAARDGRNGFAPLNPTYPLAAGLAREQRTAVEHMRCFQSWHRIAPGDGAASFIGCEQALAKIGLATTGNDLARHPFSFVLEVADLKMALVGKILLGIGQIPGGGAVCRPERREDAFAICCGRVLAGR